MTLELVCTRGLPASGKTTWARAWVAGDPEGRVRLNRDDMRAMLFGAAGAAYQEYFRRHDLGACEAAISRMEERMAGEALRSGRSVVVDATHVRASYLRRWSELAAKHGAGFSVQEMGTPADECVRRDAAREWPVGERVIRDMDRRMRSATHSMAAAGASGPASPRQYVPDETKAPAWLFDVDGTLALMDGRGPYDTSRYHEDLLCEPVAAVAHALHAWGHAIVVMSGRDEQFRPQTEEWLTRHGLPWDELWMRPRGDRRNDSVVKAELFWEHVAPRWRVLGSVDDRDRVVEMWRSIGLRCLQAAPGDF